MPKALLMVLSTEVTGKKEETIYFGKDLKKGVKVKDKLKFKEGLAPVKGGLINVFGDTVLKHNYYDITYFKGGTILGKYSKNYKVRKYGVMDLSGKVLFDTITNYIVGPVSEGLVAFRDLDHPQYLVGFMDLKGSVVIEPKFKYTGYDNPGFKNGMVSVPVGYMYGLINTKGETIIDFKYQHQIKDFMDDIAVCAIEPRLKGYIKKNGELLVEPQFYEAFPFSEGYAVAILAEDYHYAIINKKGEVKRLDHAWGDANANSVFKNGVCPIVISVPSGKDIVAPKNSELINEFGGAKHAYINTKGEIIWEGAPYYVCFPGDAMVTMADGTGKKISEIKPGEFVLSFDKEKKRICPTLVKQVQMHEGSFPMMKLKFDDPQNDLLASTEAIVSTSFLEATANHPVMTTQGVKPLSEIKINDIIYLYSDNTRKEVKVVSIKPNTYSAGKVYNLITEYGNYFVNGIMVMMK
jgi:hypothetical protein